MPKANKQTIQDRLKTDPEASNRSLASSLGVSERVIRDVRQELESAREIPSLAYVRTQNGRIQPRRGTTAPVVSTTPSSEHVLPFLSSYAGRRRMSVTNDAAVLVQIRAAMAAHPLAFLVALPFGGFVPVAVWTLTHLESIDPWDWPLIVGGALFSSLTVINWGRRILSSLPKAIGFGVLVEGVMILAETPWLSFSALGLLIIVNSVACAVALTAEDGHA